MRDDPLADFASDGGMLFESVELLIADSQRRRRVRDEVWAFHLQNRLRMSVDGISLIAEAMARIDATKKLGNDSSSD